MTLQCTLTLIVNHADAEPKAGSQDGVEALSTAATAAAGRPQLQDTAQDEATAPGMLFGADLDGILAAMHMEAEPGTLSPQGAGSDELLDALLDEGLDDTGPTCSAASAVLQTGRPRQPQDHVSPAGTAMGDYSNLQTIREEEVQVGAAGIAGSSCASTSGNQALLPDTAVSMDIDDVDTAGLMSLQQIADILLADSP